ncbi:hypothetical protein K438DRAFT_1763455 [Mycena galopus ATCC 62051]|nr:hypothetical protein K438DRAFT_1763455 [Mycena galopus ATCC 62051]
MYPDLPPEGLKQAESRLAREMTPEMIASFLEIQRRLAKVSILAKGQDFVISSPLQTAEDNKLQSISRFKTSSFKPQTTPTGRSATSKPRCQELLKTPQIAVSLQAASRLQVCSRLASKFQVPRPQWDTAQNSRPQDASRQAQATKDSRPQAGARLKSPTPQWDTVKIQHFNTSRRLRLQDLQTSSRLKPTLNFKSTSPQNFKSQLLKVKIPHGCKSQDLGVTLLKIQDPESLKISSFLMTSIQKFKTSVGHCSRVKIQDASRPQVTQDQNLKPTP